MHPSDEQVRKAVEDAIRDGLEADTGDWTATLENGRELQFRPCFGGAIEVEHCLGVEEKTYKFEVCVRLVPAS